MSNVSAIAKVLDILLSIGLKSSATIAKKKGCVINECLIKARKKHAILFTTSADYTSIFSMDQNLPNFVPTSKPKMVQQIIVSAFSTFGLFR
jgi:hypothetical protein